MKNVNDILKALPNLPGVYEFLDKSGTIIYVGKAKNLKKRVSSYFQKSKYDSFKTKILVNQINEIRHTVVDSEPDALLLENNLIKNLQPKYNILLKDDKTFPWICIKKEPFPRVFSTRKIIKDGSEYYGPYTSVLMVKTLLGLIRNLYKIRTCKYLLNEKNSKEKKFTKCLEFHIGNCKAPCESLQTEEDYLDSIKQIGKIFKGNIQEVIDHLKRMMNEFAEKLQFEEAENVKQKILILENYKSKSTIVNPKISNVDVFSFIEEDDGKHSYVNYLKVIHGAIVQSHTVEILKRMDESKEDILLYAIVNIKEKVNSNSKHLILPFKVTGLEENKIEIPVRGDKKKLMELSERNALQFKTHKSKILDEFMDKKKTSNPLLTLKEDLRLKQIPEHIECFDNSNIQGSNPVAACVVFINGKPKKSLYRRYHIKTVEGANDFASMEEIVYRRYKRLLNENKELPQLIIIDGGKGQLSSAKKSLDKLNLSKKIAVIGIAKKLEEIFFPGDSFPIYINKNSPGLKIIQQLRNEAHRFGITFHRDLRSKSLLENELEKIKGVGRISAEKLYKTYKSVDNMKEATRDQLNDIVGKRTAKLVYEYLHR